jgi:hypothetical protein
MLGITRGVAKLYLYPPKGFMLEDRVNPCKEYSLRSRIAANTAVSSGKPASAAPDAVAQAVDNATWGHPPLRNWLASARYYASICNIVPQNLPITFAHQIDYVSSDEGKDPR